MPRKKNVSVHAVQVDASRAFPIKVGFSNLSAQRSQRSHTVPIYLNDLMRLRAQQPAEKGVYTTSGLTQANMTGNGFVGDAVKYGRRKAGDAVEWAGNKGIDVARDFARGKVGNIAKKVRGDGFFRKLASGAVRGIGNIAADVIGGQVKPKRKRARRAKKNKKMEGDGFFRKLASGAVRGIGNIAADAIGGDIMTHSYTPSLKRGRKQVASGLVAPGMKN